MEQLAQTLKSGAMAIVELPMPVVGGGMVLVRNHYSLISAGTEGSTVKTARKSLLGKALEKPQQVKQVLDVLRAQGPLQTYRAVMKKLDAYSPLGYSSAGTVLEVGRGVTAFACGDRVACAGVGYANHAEVVCVPVNLCVKLPPAADLKLACYNTLGAIALQGIRQADLRLGESCCVIGLGLLGQLTGLMLRAAGIRTFGVDIDASAVATARAHATDGAWERDSPGLAEHLDSLTDGLGVDAVIVTAATASLDPINFAGRVARKKGRVIIVGAVPTGFDRDPYFYRKELEVRMSCSYGPGRYDPEYEEKGLDYPAAYVRWTEKRNMEAFQHLAHTGRMDLSYLTTHEIPLEKAPAAYDMIVNRTEPFLGVVLAYDIRKPLDRTPVRVGPASGTGKVGVAFVGAGSYAQSHLLPNLPRDMEGLVRKGIMTSSGTTSRRAAERFGFEFSTASLSDILDNPEVNTVFVATRHNSHARYALQALERGKHVFVEKPLCLDEEQMEALRTCRSQAPRTQLMVGFNRRFAPLADKLRSHMGEGPKAMLYRVNAGSIPADHWAQDPEIGGGRVLGEVCHFVDFMVFLCRSLPVRVQAMALPDAHGTQDTLTVNLEFRDGSIGSLAYFANGAKEVPKEYVEVYGNGVTGILRDFKQLEVYGGGKPCREHLLNQDKGQARMVRAFLQSVRDGGLPLIPDEETFGVTTTTFKILDALRTRQSVALEA